MGKGIDGIKKMLSIIYIYIAHYFFFFQICNAAMHI